MKRAVIIHCWGGQPAYCWYPWAKVELEKIGYQVEVPAMPHTDDPIFSKWLDTTKQAIGEPDEDLILIGHSLGTVTIMRYLETLKPEQKIGAAILVAGFTNDLGFDKIKTFFKTPFDYEKIKQRANKIIAIQSDDDPYVPVPESEILEDKLSAEIIMKHKMGHFSGSAEDEKYCGSLPEVLSAVENITK